MAIVALTPGETWEYIAQRDRKSENPTIWDLRVLDGDENAKLQNCLMKGKQRSDEISVHTGDYTKLALKLGLANVRGAGLVVRQKNEQTGEPELVALPFEKESIGTTNGRKERVTDAYLARVPYDVQAELANQIIEGNQIDDDQGKD